MIPLQSNITTFDAYRQSDSVRPLFLQGDAREVLSRLPDHSIDCCMTSPPYWGLREYDQVGLGSETTFSDYRNSLLLICREIRRVLKDTGSFWLNLGDGYQKKGLIGLPWRIALELIDEQRWIMRNDVIWNKLKGPDNTRDKLRSTHEYLFHFVKQSREYFYDVGAIRAAPRRSIVKNGAVISATGVTGVRYKRQIELSTSLTPLEKTSAFSALDAVLQRVANGDLHDFRMVIRNQQRTTHSSSTRISGRARELQENGFYFLFYHPDGSKPGDVWDIVPEDTNQRGAHYAAYPEDLCRIPILATCPQDGIVLDPFCGTGTTNLVAFQSGRKSVGIDISADYIVYAQERCNFLL